MKDTLNSVEVDGQAGETVVEAAEAKEAVVASKEAADVKEDAVAADAKEDAVAADVKEESDTAETKEEAVAADSKEEAVNGSATDETEEEANGETTALGKSVARILEKIKLDANMTDPQKVDTLCILFKKIIEENNLLKCELGMMGEQMQKSNQAKEAVKQLNSAYKMQIGLVKEENELKLQEEAAKRAECVSSYQSTMGELSTLLETHTGQNSRLRDENVGLGEKLTFLIQEGEKRENQFAHRLTEFQLQIKLLEHQVTKAQIEKSEVKADMTKERLEIAQELSLERERNTNLEETCRLLKEQSSIYQAQLDDLSTGAGNNTKSFQHFKTQIDKLNAAMRELDRDTHQWREKYEVSSNQVKKMNAQSLEREKEVAQLKKKLESMVKLNRTLTEERNQMVAKMEEEGH